MIYNNAFADGGLKTIKITSNSKLILIDEYCFARSKLSSIFIPKSLITIVSNAFNFCQLENITVDPENPNFKLKFNSLFSGANNSTLFRVAKSYSDSKYIVPNYVTNISEFCFYAVSITSIELHNKIKYIGEFAFALCSTLESINIPGSLTHIKLFTFFYFSSLSNIVFQNNLNDLKIDETAFQSISNTVNLYITGTFIPYQIIAFGLSKVFPHGSNLYITSKTVLTNSSKDFFEKS